MRLALAVTTLASTLLAAGTLPCGFVWSSVSLTFLGSTSFVLTLLQRGNQPGRDRPSLPVVLRGGGGADPRDIVQRILRDCRTDNIDAQI